MKTVLIVGANRGIGLEFCRQYKAKGKDVLAVCRKSSSALQKLGVKIFSGIDVTDVDSLYSLSQKLEDQKVDLFIHNAGIMRSTSLEHLNSEAIVEQLVVNSVAPIQTVVQLLKHLSKDAKIAVLSSRMGSMADNDSGGSYGYRMSKAAVNAAFKSLSIDLMPKGHPVAILHPGWVKTDMTQHNGLIEADESVDGLIKILDQLTLENTGQYWHTNGEVLPW